jgi:hypothetical protein
MHEAALTAATQRPTPEARVILATVRRRWPGEGGAADPTREG